MLKKKLSATKHFLLSDHGSLKSRVLRSGFWVTGAEILLQSLSFVRSVFLARLLTPEAFGLMGICTVVLRAVETFSTPGIATALIQRRDDFSVARDTAFTLLAARGLLLCILLILVSPWIAVFFEEQTLELMLMVLAATFIVGGLQNINLIAHQKALDFRKIAYLDQATALVTTVTSITLAYIFRSVWALVFGEIVRTIMFTLGSYALLPGRPRFSMNWKIARELLDYGRFVAASAIILYVATELDNLVIGKILGTEQLGFYVLAFTLANLVTTQISRLTSRVMLPAYSAIQDDIPALRTNYLRIISLVSVLVFPSAAGLLALGPDFVVAIYGERWINVFEPLSVLLVFGVSRAFASVNGYLFQGVGKPNLDFQSAAVRLVVLAPIIAPMVYQWGLIGAAFAVTLGIVAQWAYGVWRMRKLLDVTLVSIFSEMVGPLWKALLMGCLVWVIKGRLETTSISLMLGLVLIGVVFYVLFNITYIRRLLTIMKS